MLKTMAQVLINGGLRRRHTDTAPALLPAPAPEQPRDEDTALLPTYPSLPAASPLASQAWAGQLVLPTQPQRRIDLDPYRRHIPHPTRGDQA